MCFAAYMMIDNTECDPASKPAAQGVCDNEPCEEGD